MSNLTPDSEKATRASLKALVETLGEVQTVFTRRVAIDSKQDFVKKLGKPVNTKLEVRYVLIEFLGFVDSPDEGCEDNPTVDVSYNIHVFFEFADVRPAPSTSNSHDEFVAYILNLRNLFLQNFDVVLSDASHVENYPLTQTTFIVTNTDPLTDCDGHFADFRAKVTIN